MKISTLLLALLLIPGVSRAGFSSSAAGSSTAGFLKLGAGARASAMGEAAVATVDDATALYWNPGALALVEGRSVVLMHAPHFDSSFHDYAAFSRRLDWGTLAVGLQYFSAGSIDGTDASGGSIGSFTPNDLALTAGYAADFGGFSVGGAVKFVRSKVLETAQTAAIDLGVLSPAYSDGRLRLGATVSNLGGKMEFESESESLPLALRVGTSFKLHERWLAALDVAFPKDNSPYAALGTEYRLPLQDDFSLAGRAGYNSRNKGDVEGLNGFSMGLGFGFGVLGLDYAFTPFGDVGKAHRISLSAKF